MQTQRDHVHAYQFMVGRMVSGLVLGDPTRGEMPSRRAILGLVAGTAVAVLATAAFGVYGLLRPGGNDAWRVPGSIIVEKETGTRFVYLDGVLRPTMNYTSALLIEGTRAKVRVVSRNSLAGVPRGAPIGIMGAPDVVPGPAELTTGPWVVCLPRGAGEGGGPSVTLDLRAGTPTRQLGEDRYGLVGDQGGAEYLVQSTKKYRLADDSVAVALGIAPVRPPIAPAMWLDAVPDGPEIRAAEVPGRGSPGGVVAGRRWPVGQLFRQHGGGGRESLYVLLRDGLAPLTETEAALLAVRGVTAVELDAASVASAVRSADDTLLHRLPDLMKSSLVEFRADALCLSQRAVAAPGAATGSVSSTVVLASPVDAGHKGPDLIRMLAPPAVGMLVSPVPVPQGRRDPERYLISGLGVRHRLADDAAVAALGLGGVSPLPMARDLLDGVPAGPTLSRPATSATVRG